VANGFAACPDLDRFPGWVTLGVVDEVEGHWAPIILDGVSLIIRKKASLCKIDDETFPNSVSPTVK
jgi:hypothetical protein